jgi:S-adenosylmethionine:tRNA-ribosyltransferase-isomerase (queuine synthetase)
MVVETGMVTCVVEPMGQLVTDGGHLVIVETEVVHTVEVVNVVFKVLVGYFVVEMSVGEVGGEVGRVITMTVEPGRDDFVVAVGTTIVRIVEAGKEMVVLIVDPVEGSDRVKV